jgi:tetratricopeptide (TPR) repeat protein
MTLRRLGRFDEAISHFNTAASLAPGDERYAFQAVETLSRLGRIDEAEPLRESLVARYPANTYERWLRYFNQFQATGNASSGREEFERLAPLLSEEDRTNVRYLMLLANGDLAGVVGLLQAHVQDDLWLGSRDFILATTLLALGDAKRARQHLDATVAGLSTNYDSSGAVAEGAIALELLGRSSEAIKAADRAVALRPERTDAINGTWVAMLRAWVLIHSTVRAEEGYAELERLLGSIDLQPRWVAASPHWLLLRDDARTQAIIRARFPQT